MGLLGLVSDTPLSIFRGEFGLREYSEVKTVTVKIPQKNS